MSQFTTAKRLLIFDLDGTLVDSLADLHATVNHVRDLFGLASVTPAQTRTFIGDGLRCLVQRAVAEAVLAGIDLDQGCAQFQEYYTAHLLNRTCLYPGVSDLLPQLAETWQLAVVTNKPQQQAEQLCTGLGLAPWLQLVHGGEPGRPLKPLPDGVLFACAQANCRPSEAWMIGDHCTDLAAARAAGMRSCFCCYGFGEKRGEPYDCQIESFRQLQEVLF